MSAREQLIEFVETVAADAYWDHEDNGRSLRELLDAVLAEGFEAGRRAGAEEERSAIANLAESRADDFIAIGQAGAFRRLAAAIRARGEGGQGCG